jgi:hypothetical protein
MKKTAKYSWGIFFISFSTLLYELSLTRVYSVTLWYHFGFLIISTALLGFGVSGIVLLLWKKLRVDYDLDKSLGWLAIMLSFSIVICFWVQQLIPFDPFNLYAEKMQLLYMPVTYILVSVPFFFAGLALSLLFSRFPTQINRLYAFDLAGAALGCLSVILFMSIFGGGGCVVLAAAFAAFAALILTWKSQKMLSWIAVAFVLLNVFISIHADQIIPLRITANKSLSASKNKPVFTRWNTFSRVDLYIDSSSWRPDKKSVVFAIDQGTAMTGLGFDLKPDVKTTLKEFSDDANYGSCIAYLAVKKPSIFIIGSGCGTQVLDALHHGAKKITAVDINPIINEEVKQNPYWSDLFHQPEVELVTDEGRNYVRTSKEKYDAIVSVHTISNAAVASGSLSLAENYVLTREAFSDYFDHLTDSGIIYFTRPEFQLPRLFATGREVLQEKAITEAAGHFFAYTFPVSRSMTEAGRKSFYSIFMMSKSPFTESQVNGMHAFIDLSKSDSAIILYDPFIHQQNIYDSVLTFANLKNLYTMLPYEVAPATDNKPFFNHHSRWSSLNLASFKDIFSQKKMGRMALEDKPVAEVSLIVLFIQVLIISGIFILLPLWKYSNSGLRIRNTLPWLVYFSGLGCGFIMIELVMIQLFGLLLGEPVYTFAIVLTSILLFTGFGAYLSGRYAMQAKRLIQTSVFLLACLLLTYSFFLTPVLRYAIGLPMWGRIVLTISLILPLGILLGIPFPSGIQLVNKQKPSFISWAWGINGFFTVIGSVVSLILSMMIGFQAVLWLAIVIYLLSMISIRNTNLKI